MYSVSCSSKYPAPNLAVIDFFVRSFRFLPFPVYFISDESLKATFFSFEFIVKGALYCFYNWWRLDGFPARLSGVLLVSSINGDT